MQFYVKMLILVLAGFDSCLSIAVLVVDVLRDYMPKKQKRFNTIIDQLGPNLLLVSLVLFPKLIHSLTIRCYASIRF